MKPRSAGYGAPYPPVSGANNANAERGFKQRMPDKQILEHDRRRAIEVRVMEERERLEEENERVEEGLARGKGGKKVEDRKDGDEEEGEAKEDNDDVDVRGRVLTEEEIEERCEALRAKLLKEMEDESSGSGARSRDGRGKMAPPRDRRQIKSYQVHELAEAKIEESERLRRALGIREDRETGEISSRRGERRGRD